MECSVFEVRSVFPAVRFLSPYENWRGSPTDKRATGFPPNRSRSVKKKKTGVPDPLHTLSSFYVAFDSLMPRCLGPYELAYAQSVNDAPPVRSWFIVFRVHPWRRFLVPPHHHPSSTGSSKPGLTDKTSVVRADVTIVTFTEALG